ncbi:small ribosomal subunit protein uS10m [Denticeps clupeoides]|uniref:small ribosomal subunit protein uS10m n=1 Tax=Denticeps clupeoides TaxID=299321 RepID=UPI0010A2C472|nr:28S ribosomal protein S10, mitochondrial [Denticeps clupeoides]XP_028858733.1 28S ribosomal protein S10, mitochondrial [Denticeps clupeoides]XP_028858734.1 28S ribosomal protein S10, mitochondrial [Denticeps clupeoides]
MAAPIILCRNLRAVSGGIFRLYREGARRADFCLLRGRQNAPSEIRHTSLQTQFHTGAVFQGASPSVTVTDEADLLFKKITVLVKGHDKAVLDSYEFFASMAAHELGIKLGKVYEPPKDIERFTLLKSIHIFKKHRVQYEMRTHYRCIELSHITGSTARVYLEYIQRNLPEGVAMEVKKVAIEKVPEHIEKPMWDDAVQKAQTSK